MIISIRLGSKRFEFPATNNQLAKMIPNSPLLVVTGPTSSGKTILAWKCACFLKNNYGIEAEIINADASQLYGELKILTAYPFPEILGQIRHNLYGILSPLENSSVALWLKLALENVRRLQEEGKATIFCGGTGFYIGALLNGVSHIPTIPADFRKKIRERFQEIGREVFFRELANLDPFSAKALHPANTHRILRAYEVVAYTGKPLSQWWEKRETVNLPITTVILSPPRNELNARCLHRINGMVKNGLLTEVENFLIRYPNYQGALCNVIGYDEALQLLKKKITEQECLNQIYVKTRRYAKRQLTWFRNQLLGAHSVPNFGNEVDPEEILEKMKN
ncbi:MAG: tRNA (adenosine(37)-N6)-dimethylallyltransferase MiaA [Holosporaceae bacterium]|jgi:tRNA dimethylallyltransferase|nr:tRNA (adenosine(37)-N6)-dimethylallyltransferase MiaA [Holosporaceae bacterium]